MAFYRWPIPVIPIAFKVFFFGMLTYQLWTIPGKVRAHDRQCARLQFLQDSLYVVFRTEYQFPDSVIPKFKYQGC